MPDFATMLREAESAGQAAAETLKQNLQSKLEALEGAYRVYCEINRSSRALKEFEGALALKGGRPYKRRDMALNVIRLLMPLRSLDRRAKYASVIRYARTQHVEPDGFLEFLRANRGIDKVAAAARAAQQPDGLPKSPHDEFKVVYRPSAFEQLLELADSAPVKLSLTATLTKDGSITILKAEDKGPSIGRPKRRSAT